MTRALLLTLPGEPGGTLCGRSGYNWTIHFGYHDARGTVRAICGADWMAMSLDSHEVDCKQCLAAERAAERDGGR
jgi:hypothetical protein